MEVKSILDAEVRFRWVEKCIPLIFGWLVCVPWFNFSPHSYTNTHIVTKKCTVHQRMPENDVSTSSLHMHFYLHSLPCTHNRAHTYNNNTLKGHYTMYLYKIKRGLLPMIRVASGVNILRSKVHGIFESVHVLSISLNRYGISYERRTWLFMHMDLAQSTVSWALTQSFSCEENVKSRKDGDFKKSETQVCFNKAESMVNSRQYHLENEI